MGQKGVGVTEDEAFKEILAEDLRGFGYDSVAADHIPDKTSVVTVMDRVYAWWNGLDGDTQQILREYDLSSGLWGANYLSEFPLLYNLLEGNKFGSFRDTMIDINRCVQHAKDGAADRAAQHLDTTVSDVDPSNAG